MWALHDRLEGNLTEETCRAEIDSFTKHGQLMPALGRSLRGDPDYEVELIYGARRLFVARHINIPLTVELRDMSDREALIAMDIENRQRVDISPYERGLSYARWLRSGHFETQDDIARTLKISASQVSRLLKIARLPAIVVDAFRSPADICEGWGLELSEALEDAEKRQAIIRKARAVCVHTPRLPAREVSRQLLSATMPGRKIQRPAHDEVVKDSAGRALFRMKHRTGSIAIVVPLKGMSPRVLAGIRTAMTRVLTQPMESVLTAQISSHDANGAAA
jgi:ParB family chromosome partitioning protein